MKRILFMLLLSLGVLSMHAQFRTVQSDSARQAEYRSKLQLDYTMPDFSTSKIDPRVMGPRLAAILTRINDIYTQPTNLSALSMIQSSQVEGLSYGRIKTMKLDRVSKQANKIIIRFKTTLESYNLNLKKSHIIFQFEDGVSEDKSINDFFSNICRYIKE